MGQSEAGRKGVTSVSTPSVVSYLSLLDKHREHSNIEKTGEEPGEQSQGARVCVQGAIWF